MSKSKELTILIAWHNEIDAKRIACYEENKLTFEKYNAGVDIITIISPFENSKTAWLSTDLTIFQWYNIHKDKINSERFLLLEWDCWCDINAKEYYLPVWNYDLIVPSVVYPERDSWQWFNTMSLLPLRARLYATGIIPFCGILVSEKAMRAINDEILKPEYEGLNSELRFTTIATMLGFDPVPNPVCSRAITWKKIAPFDGRFRGLHHPRKTLTPVNILDKIEEFIGLETTLLPKIIHQTWKNELLPENLSMLAETWKELHPDWHYILWTDEMNREFIKRFFPDFLLQYDSYPKNIQKVDAVRYFILYKIGGLFVDLDFECTENIEPLIADKECVFALEPQEHCEQFKKDKIICNAFMASKPANLFFNAICNSLPSFTWKKTNLIDNILGTTGPFALTEIYNGYNKKEKITLLPSNTVYPLTVKETRRAIAGDIDPIMQGKIDCSYAIHYFFGTWYSTL
jgi:hypothetical protein